MSRRWVPSGQSMRILLWSKYSTNPHGLSGCPVPVTTKLILIHREEKEEEEEEKEEEKEET